MKLTINDNNRKYYYDLLMPMYKKEYSLKKERIEKIRKLALEEKKYKGKKLSFLTQSFPTTE